MYLRETQLFRVYAPILRISAGSPGGSTHRIMWNASFEEERRAVKNQVIGNTKEFKNTNYVKNEAAIFVSTP